MYLYRLNIYIYIYICFITYYKKKCIFNYVNTTNPNNSNQINLIKMLYLSTIKFTYFYFNNEIFFNIYKILNMHMMFCFNKQIVLSNFLFCTEVYLLKAHNII